MNDVENYLKALEERVLTETVPQCPLEQPLPRLTEREAIDQMYQNSPDRLACDRKPLYESQAERPEHRVMVFLKAQGFSDKEIAERLEVTPFTVRYVLKQPWARLRLMEEIKTNGRDGVAELLKGAASDCVMTLIDVMRDEKAKNSDRVTASNSILDRFLGRPMQRVETINTNINTTMKDVEKMQSELQEVEQELQRVTGHVKN